MNQNRIKDIINRSGSRVKIIIRDEDSGETTEIDTIASIQALRYKSNNYISTGYLPSGYFNGNYYLYIGPRDVRLDLFPLDTLVISGNDKYIVKSSEKVFAGNQILYIWAALEKYVEYPEQ